MRHKFEDQLQELKKKIVEMSVLVEKALEQAMESLKNRDMALAEKVVSDDGLINDSEQDIELLCTHLVATQQPFASDLRNIVASYKIISSLERMGDLSVDIAKVSLRIGPDPLIKPLIDMPKMAEIAIQMMRTAVQAFIYEDIELARSLAETDHKVDHYYKLIFNELNEMMAQDSAISGQAVYLLLATRYIERIGDYCTNIGEEVIYMQLGVRENLNK
ncbi:MULTISPECIES: phosphate signaling complex protein PhoU [unclassified Dehalobacter]|uniref:phosphate signaling complex protein PhoU n=1 Tax=unclassified Dehalobacter TaxID=2635733 RepID=UPI000E6C38F3|nr:MULTISPECIES: phosphate signaling complex protein PhoU [unclassified Dehalobacter]RJE48299.1 phosphate transport system regulatory protein PhoU [Dehalobacter sp. MCB1]TCX50366.1 phosphate transport system regulatory protein PhoU [Dehalobacter sp. 14DCB1]TCX52394.1 phosphate transport system regulatory protein PhoU [Dehalobacter sp. 12DCB1]